jgi:hypothetical protein
VRLTSNGLLDLRSAASPQLVFFHQGFTNNSSQLNVAVQPAGGAWTVVWSTGSPPSVWTRQQVDLSAYAGTKVRVRFEHLSYAYQYYHVSTWSVDEITLSNAPANVALSPASSIGEHGATLSWTPSTDPTFLRYELRRRPGSGVVVTDAVAASLSSAGSTSFIDGGLLMKPTPTGCTSCTSRPPARSRARAPARSRCTR